MSTFIFPKLPTLDPLREAINNAYREDEATCLEELINAATLPDNTLLTIQNMAEQLIVTARKHGESDGLDAFLIQYDLSTEEGVALMCLAEAVLRVPDTATVDKLIEDKIAELSWDSQRGRSDSSFVNAASWALMLTGKILRPEQQQEGFLNGVLRRLVKKSSAPVIRKAVAHAMRIMGRQFVMGSTIAEAIKNSKKAQKNGFTFSYDMLGEAARTAHDAERYFQSYQQAISAIAAANVKKDVYRSGGISVKLSALHPRYEYANREQAVPELVTRLRTLALQAKAANIHLTVDAEEADRLDISLDIFEAVSADPVLADWDGLGLAVQAYQKRAYYLIDWLADLAKRHHRRLMVRLVKGAYWDYEIKDSQTKGLAGYPVFTRKVNTDVSYLACAKKLLGYGSLFYPQFATHNAYTIAAILAMVGDRRDFEFQCLKGMGTALYDQLLPSAPNAAACRVYAPVGRHQDLLPYLVRRLLENGANTSFVNRLLDNQTAVADLVAHPVAQAEQLMSKSHPRIPLPADLFGEERKNSAGIDFSNTEQLTALANAMQPFVTQEWQAMPTFSQAKAEQVRTEISPCDHTQVVGKVTMATQADVEVALQKAAAAAEAWDQVPVAQRASYLDKLADLFEENQAELMALAVREAGKALPDALGEVREAVDYCRYYAAQARRVLAPQDLPGPTGESNQLTMHGRGVFLCISPWNFPLAIFTGQILAALVAGNCVIAKPAEQTSLIGARAVDLMHQAGIPRAVVQLLPGKGSVIGALAVADERIAGVMFTGSTETARGINQTLAQRSGPLVPFIAETGGQNAMIADSTALAEQLVMDVLASAFNSAGQRCSALRVLFLQSEMADGVIAMLKGAMAELRMGNPAWLATDIGPVIDNKAKEGLEEHLQYLNRVGRLIYAVPLPKGVQYGSYFAPCAYEIPSLDLLQREVFGPVLHVIRYEQRNLDQVLAAINATGYGLTLGIHSRIDATVQYIQRHTQVGNTYVNRNMIGAVVGVQPFGGERLSGTGPKAGGPHTLLRLCHERTLTVNTTAAGGNASLMAMGD